MKDKIYPKLTREKLAVGQYCKTNGFIIRSGLNLNVCDDETCVNCQEFVKAMEEASKKYKL